MPIADIRIRDYETSDAENLNRVGGPQQRIGHGIALHTSPMSVALPMYLGIGFVKAHDAPLLYGVPYAVYTKAL